MCIRDWFKEQFEDAGDYDNAEDWLKAEGNRDKWYKHLAGQGHHIFNDDYSKLLQKANEGQRMLLFHNSASDARKESFEELAYNHGGVSSTEVNSFKKMVDLMSDPATSSERAATIEKGLIHVYAYRLNALQPNRSWIPYYQCAEMADELGIGLRRARFGEGGVTTLL
jgi:hypothetical protein